MRDRLTKITIFCLSSISLITIAHAVKAQDGVSGIVNSPMGEAIDNFNNSSSSFSQPVFLPDTSSSQQFFKQGREQLYLLPEDTSDDILKIDRTIEAEGINWENLQEINDNSPK